MTLVELYLTVRQRGGVIFRNACKEPMVWPLEILRDPALAEAFRRLYPSLDRCLPRDDWWCQGAAETLPATEKWDSLLARFMLEDARAERYAKGLSCTTPPSVDDAYLSEDMEKLTKAVARWRRGGRKNALARCDDVK